MNSRLPTTAARRFALLGAIGAVSLTVLGTTGDARAQIAGTTTRPLPNVLLLVDSSGSMERMGDNSLPADNNGGPTPSNICSPGVESTPNRWGMLIQALTGNLQPFFSCDAIARNDPSFKNEFRIGGTGSLNQPYDADYFLPYHRPLTGTTAINACAFAPYTLPGAAPGQGLGPSGLGVNTGLYTDASSFPPNAFQPFREKYLRDQYRAGANGSALTASAANTCTFEQANDGQLDSTRDYIRFGLMMFDNDVSAATGVSGALLPNGGNVTTGDPFTGQWSYIKSGSGPTPNPDPLGFGRPLNCGTTSPFEVGARHWAAPPWEGRMVKFPNPDGTLFDIARTNEEIQKVLIGTRPYGATPIDGMMEDARDYLWYNDYGPNGSQDGYKDAYVKSDGCRKQYIVLLTDGAPNLDLRPACEPGGLPGSLCPYPSKAAQTADKMANAPVNGQKVTTYVIGFSVNGAGSKTFTNDGFPAAYPSPASNNCKAWFNGVTTNGANLGAMHATCSTPATAPPKGSTADACCQLSEIAYFGSAAHDTPPFFAETQADLVLSFGRVLGGISKTATTRTLPAYSPAVTVSGQGITGDFVASFIPNAQKVWSGEIDRTRSVCQGAVPTTQAQAATAGDSFAYNTALQASVGRRLFVSVKADSKLAVAPFTGQAVDSARTIRPWVTTTPLDGIAVADSGGAQVNGLDLGLTGTADWPAALDIDDNTCKRSKGIDGLPIPKLTASQCTNVVWGFATAHAALKGPLTYNGHDFNVRCRGASSATAGACSVSGGGCTLNGPPCPTAGEVCVPECSALGAIYRSSPTLIGPPNDLLRDDDYRAFTDLRKFRRPAMFVASTDGVLHAYKALSTSGAPTFDNIPSEHELWAFVPPAVLPKLASNYPSGQQILLDGTPAVKDIVWDRYLRPEAPLYHTTLVSGMGAGGGGYYALNVSDVDCQGVGSTGIGTAINGCLGLTISNPTTLSDVASNTTKGPQFLWQLTDVLSTGAGETAKPLRTSRDGKTFVALFGKESGNAAIATLLMKPDDKPARQIGVAILPGGIDGPPIKGGSCLRAINNGSQGTFSPTNFDLSDTATPLRARNRVRQWATDCLHDPVPGRNVTIVRADTGEIIRVFGRPNQDVPNRLNNVLTQAPFDSPIIGTPAIFPNTVGVTTQKIFVGDADGTIWRIDVSNPDPTLWKVTLFQDLMSSDLGNTFADSQPVQVPPVLTQDPFGGIIISAATGDQENIVASSTEKNILMTIQEQKAIDPATPGRAVVRWYQPFTNAARVTGPMTVFDRTLYFATYQPSVPTSAGSCTNGGNALLWGMDYFNPKGGTVTAATGGLPRWCPATKVDGATGACTDPLIQFEPAVNADAALAGAIIPGVTIRASQSCASYGGSSTDPLITGMSATSFSLFFGATAKGSGGASTGTPQAARPTTPLLRPLPRTAANIDSWALIVD